MRHPGIRLLFPVVLVLVLFFPFPAHAARIGDIIDTAWMEQVRRFFSFQDPAVRYAVAGSVFLGLACGLLGSFIVVRRLALMGDTLSHAVLPGVALGFLWNLSKDPLAIFAGATIAGLLGTLTVSLITRTTRLKEDTALGMVLAVFFAIGACLLTMIQRVPTGAQSGIQQFLFGQAAAIGPEDLWLMGSVSLLVLAGVFLFFKELLVTSFDSAFAQATGIPAQWVHHGLMLLLAFSIVISLQAVGVVLVSAMLIIPAATAYLLTERMPTMLVLAALFGIFSGIFGSFLSFLGNNLPTGPFMVLATGTLFFLVFLFSPRHGIVVQAWRKKALSRRFRRENILKALYHILEEKGFDEKVFLHELATQCGESLKASRRGIRSLARHNLAITNGARENEIRFTRAGWQQAASIVRNHRLWELYLTHAVEIAADHVHDDAEKIEHILGEETVRKLECFLGSDALDPHGKPIPTSRDIAEGSFPPGIPKTGNKGGARP